MVSVRRSARSPSSVLTFARPLVESALPAIKSVRLRALTATALSSVARSAHSAQSLVLTNANTRNAPKSASNSATVSLVTYLVPSSSHVGMIVSGFAEKNAPSSAESATLITKASKSSSGTKITLTHASSSCSTANTALWWKIWTTSWSCRRRRRKKKRKKNSNTRNVQDAPLSFATVLATRSSSRSSLTRLTRSKLKLKNKWRL